MSKYSTPQFLGKLDAQLPIRRPAFLGGRVDNFEMIVVLLDRQIIGGGKGPIVFTTNEDILHIINQIAKRRFPPGNWIVENYLSDSFDDYPNYCHQYECV